jgi:heme exporter protein B
LAAILCTALLMPTGTDFIQVFIGLLLGGLSFAGIGLLGAALTLGARRAATLQAVIVMPLCVPPLIFGAGASSSLQLGVSQTLPLFLLAAFSMATLTLAPFATAAIVRMKVISS